MSLLATRITEGNDLKQAITDFAKERGLQAAVVVCAVGSLSKARIRMVGATPDQQDIREYDNLFEIVSLNGTIASDGSTHLHISISDKVGQVIGGHLKEGCIVHTTVELVVANEQKLQFVREHDAQTGFQELVVKERAS